MPIVSVVLPVYNTEQHIRQAIQSVLDQTFEDFELIIIDDRSTDNTASVIHSINDRRIRYMLNEQNLGRAGSDNAAMAWVTGKYIARMDGDDICHPQRFEKQVHFLEANPDINVTGGWMQNFGSSSYLNKYPATPEAAQCRTLFTLPVGNPSVMQRTSLFTEHGMSYDASLRQSEDYDFFARYIRELRVATIQETLIQYRNYAAVAKEEVLKVRAASADRVRNALLSAWGLDCTAREQKVHCVISDLSTTGNLQVTIPEAEAWLSKLLIYNQQNRLFEPSALERELSERWFHFCYAVRPGSLSGMRTYYRSTLAKAYRLSPVLKTKFLLKSLKP